ncbi:HolA [Desulforapulum autotrophicum HRM2]|uniref:DNA-directed DNA polymerase n=1 Tax=Desulforapulum autotrophicum (strain ATCC 43914 / DSM 3382 / VKM B-1955 / HRM2) TaxID=177437 RepID=C0QGT7_DESAH|nr:protein HolA [Desulforapulum autotrophicum]ACN15586.1 HolA [Desulforapulum autotrophicum HRM2]
MPEINYNALSKFLASEPLPGFFLAYGEAFLTRKAFDKIIAALVPEERRELSYELLEGVDASLANVKERLATYSFEPLLVLGLKNAPLFSAPTAPKVAGFSKQEIDTFQKFIKKPFLEGHFLVVTTDTADKRRALFKEIKAVGLVIDCSVPKGSRQADKTQQSAILRQIMEGTLNATGKGIDGDAFAMLVDRTGFDPSTLSDNLEKLVSFIGERVSITVQDVQKVVKRTRKDAIFELTNAVCDRNAGTALFYLKSLLNAGFHPLQIVMALSNQLRKLVLVKFFIERSRQRGIPCWQPNSPYNRFKQHTMPMIEQADAEITATAENWDRTLAGHAAPTPAGKSGKPKTNKNLTDLLIAPNKNNTYPVYHTFLKTDNFSLAELKQAITRLSEVDMKMKRSANDPEIVLDNLILWLCTKGEKNA